tara:strand:- start:853 stop:1293 length:441 start_codon:yes stop_codon:yes gene_type:complete
MSPQETVIANLAFDRAFLDKVKAVETARRKTLHTNGVPSHYIFVFKTICVLKDEEMSIENISNKYREIFGRNINASSLSRTLTYLSDRPDGGVLNLIYYKDNPFTSDSRFKGVSLTGWGKKMQEIFLNVSSYSSHNQTKEKIRSVL